MKMNKFVSILTLGLAALTGSAAYVPGDGDIVDIRAVDSSAMKYGERNRLSGEACSPENPLVAGETLCIRMRLQVRNADTVAASGGAEKPLTWKFWDVANARWAADGVGPKLGIMVGSRIDWADFSATGLNVWQFSGELHRDDNGAETDEYCYYTDFYFTYRVKSGDVGLPIRLLNRNLTVAATEISTVEYALLGLNVGSAAYELCASNDGAKSDKAVLCRTANGLMADWPKGPWTDQPVFDGPILSYDLSQEGIYAKTVDFDFLNAEGGDWSEGQIWRRVTPGGWDKRCPNATVKIVGGAAASEDTTVYVWSSDESVFVPDGVTQTINIGTTENPTNRQVMTVTIYKGQPSATFALKGAPGANLTDTATLYMTSTKGIVSYDGAGTMSIVAMERPIGVAEAQPPTVKVRLNNLKDTTATVTADSDYKTAKAELWVIVEGETKQKTVVDLKATVGGSRSLNDLVKNNDIRLTAGGYDIMSELSQVEVEAGTGTRHATVYVYALGTEDDIRTDGIRFEPEIVTADPDVKKDNTPAATLTIARQGEEVIEFTAANPADGSTVKATKTEDKTFRVKFADSYRNYTAPKTGAPYTYKGYTFKFFDDDTGDEYTFAEGVTPSAEGSWVTVKGKFNFPGLSLGTHTLYFYGEAMDGSTTERMRFVVELTSSVKVAEVSLFDPSASTTVCEGDSVDVKLKLKSAFENGYIFLRPDPPEDATRVTSALFATGAPIDSADNTEVVNPQLVTYLDGAERPGTPVVLRAFLGTNQTDPEAKVAGWEQGQLRLIVTNKPPVVKSLVVASQAVQAKNAGKALEAVSSGIPKVFELTSVSDVKADWDTMDIKWVIDNEIIEKHGDPTNKANTVTYTFSTAKAGRTLDIAVYVKDKDMSDYPDDANYYTTVNVLKKPNVSISTAGTVIADTFLENDPSTGTVQVRLSEPPDEPVEVKFTVSQPTTGYLRFQPVEGSVETTATPGEYVLKFPAAATYKELKLLKPDGMDGTLATSGGVVLNAEVTTETLNADGVPWKDFYTKAEPLPVYVLNVAPTFKRPNDFEIANTNMNASLNTPYAVKLQVGDVEADLRDEWTHNGNVVSGVYFTVEVNDLPYTNGYLHASAATPTVSDLVEVNVTFLEPGAQKVTVTFEDKDRESNTCNVFFDVQASKVLKLYPVGPGPAASTTGSRYSIYQGAGAGRVFAGAADVGPQMVENFIHTYSFAGTRTDVDLWAFGYKADGKEDDGSLLPGPDQWLLPYGNWDQTLTKPEAGGFYNYTLDDRNAGSAGYDSFMYGWVGSSSKEDDGDNAAETFYPYLKSLGYRNVQLPNGQDNSSGKQVKSYPLQKWEAIFSREFLTSDNCGDINHDGIPDLVLFNYGLGVVDVATQEISGDEGDKKDVSAYNEDVNDSPRGYTGEKTAGDFLPVTAVGLSAYEAYGIMDAIGTWDEPFTAVLEIRGAGVKPNGDMPLNDAFAEVFPDGAANRLAFSEVKSDSYYLDPDLHPTSTLSRVEWLAWQDYAASHGIADPSDPAGWRNAQGRLVWSPERPTLPTAVDTDGDGFPDGYEYYYWYRAHVGYMDGAVHRYLTGRRYDPRNPGEGTVITREQIEQAMDPIRPSASLEQDTDFDGIPDLLEMLIGTDPFDFDTDGDGLPDGWEIMISATSPLSVYTTQGVSDAMRNYDGDAMAFTTPKLERNEVQPKPLVTPDRFTFALAEPNGDSDGVQWYVGMEAPTNVTVGETGIACVSFKVGGQLYVTTSALALAGKFVTPDGRLAIDLGKDCTWEALAAADPALSAYSDLSAIGDDYVRLMPVRLAAGTPVTDCTDVIVDDPGDPEADPPVPPTTRAPTCATLAFDAIVKDVNAAWFYGRANVSTLTGSAAGNSGGFGMLAVGRNQDATNTFAIAALPKPDENVAYVHYLVYQEFGFDPRTAWNANSPLAARWKGKGYVGTATRTREYTAYDEFLVYSFFLNNGANLNYVTVRGPKSPSLVDSWFANTTNPQGPGEPDIDFSTAASTEGTEVKYYGRNSENGADTDGDGVPDGWELYIMAGPKQAPSMFEKERFFFVAPYGDEKSVFSPFVADAGKGSTDVFPKAGDSDGFTERQEFAGTDSCNYYSVTTHKSLDGNEYVYSDTVVRPEEHAKWLNKFFPTDPWNTDTDGDGIEDGFENKNYTISGTTANFNCANFIYGEPADDGKLTSIPGGGLNPCSVDTDQDGIPDAWEAQFAGNPGSLYAGADADFAKDESDNNIGNALQGLTDGMDGTVKDACNYVYISKGETPQFFQYGGAKQVVDRDYDHDGLDNWQEYLTSAMRCWRYDDPYSVWQSIPNSVYYDEDGIFNPFRPESLKALGIDPNSEEAAGEFWYKTLFDKTSPIYNPHLVTDTGTGSQYYTRVWNEWDPNYSDTGTYYIFHHRIGNELLINFWGNAVYEDLIQPNKYISCSPIKADTDGDGMDDYYELFHGLNPLLGEVGGLSTDGGMVDVVYDAWVVNGRAPFDAVKNIWTENAKALLGRAPRTNDPKNNKYDFELFPWLAGLAAADADGDDLRNQSEAIMAMLAPETHHTDPSALWLTDSSYTNSLVSRFYRLPATYTDIVLPKDADGGSTFEYQGQTYAFTDCDGFYWDMFGGAHLAPFTADHWSLTSVASKNWFVSFEENEGYDTDHDGISDFEELQGRPTGTVSDPQNADAPHRRQAMYFPGQDAALQTMPFVREEYPRVGYDYQDDRAFLEYTVECWVRPEDVSTSTTNTVIERAIWSSYSAAGDEELLRKNFQLGIRNGCWYTKFDANGTLKDSLVELQSTVAAESGLWTHIAATYNRSVLRLYVNGVEVKKNAIEEEYGVSGRGLTPEYGASAVIVRPGEDLTLTNGQYVGREDKFWKDSEYPLHAIIIGASAKSQADFGGPTKISKNHLDVMNGRGWSCYKDFFKGYVDEVRVWDGARGPDEIKADMTKRYTAADVQANREKVYAEWSKGLYRYDKVGKKGAATESELRFHWSFDSLPAAENAEMVAKQAHGYGYVDPTGATQGGAKAPLGRPAGYEITWWKKILDGYTGTVYGNPAYVTWVPNTVTHLPRFDGTTLDSAYWAEDAEGARSGTYSFANTSEPASRWTQYVRRGAFALAGVVGDTQQSDYGDFKTTARRFWQVNVAGSNAVDNVGTLFEFTGRHLNQQGDDLLPLGGAFVKYVDEMWDEKGPSTASEITGTDDDNNGLADWWEAYAKDNYEPESEPLTWTTFVTYENMRMTAGQAYLFDLAKGFYADRNGNITTGDETYRSAADEDNDGMPDWWELVHGIHTGDTDLTAGGHANGDSDHDGLSNYQEYLAGLNPSTMKSDGFILDYFRRTGEEEPLLQGPRRLLKAFDKTYFGAKYTDHDMVDDRWEDKWLDPTYASRLVWDALNDADGDGWSLFAERRYMSYKVNGMANLVSHLVGANETPDMPMPTVKLTVRYNGNQLEVGPKNSGSAEEGQPEEKQPDVTKPGEEETAGKLAPYYVYAYADRAMTQPNAIFKVEPGAAVSKTLYIGGWENRMVHGTLAPGHVDFSTLDLEFAQLQQSDRYSWYDGTTLHLAEPYADFKAALLRNPDILQNVQSFEWLHLTAPQNKYGVSADKAITVSRVENEQKGYINLYGERIGTIDLETGDFALDMGEIVKTAVPYTFKTTSAGAWSYKEGVFRLTYKAVVPALNRHETTFSLAKADEGYLREGKNSFLVFSDINGNEAYDVGEPFGVVRDVEIGWDQVPSLTVELTDKPVIETDAMPRVMVAENGTDVPVTIVRTAINGEATIERTVLSRKMDFSHRGFFTEQDVLRGRMFDLDWANLLVDAENEGIAADQIESATYRLQVGNGEPVTFTRAFAPIWKAPLAVSPTKNTAHVLRAAQPTFVWDGDDNYTAFEIEVADANDTVVWTSGVRLMPAEKDEGRSFTAPVYAALKDVANKGEAALSDGETYKWRVAQFNAKFNAARADRAWSDWAEFKVDLSAGAGYGRASVDVRYYGSGNGVSKGDVVVGLYKTGDFTGAPVAAMRLNDGDIVDLALEPTNFTEPQPDNLITFAGVKPGDYYVMAFIDRNGNGVRDIFESWGYANRHGDPTTDDHYDPVSVTVADTAAVPPARVVFMEDTAINGTDLDCDRDLGELEDFARGSLRDSDHDGLSDEEEEEEYFTKSDDPDTDKDGMPDGWEELFAGMSALRPGSGTATPGDLMAYAEEKRTLVTLDNGEKYLLEPGKKVRATGDVLKYDGQLWSCYEYGNAVDENGKQIYGLGQQVNISDPDRTIRDQGEEVTVALVHNQVYQKYGYSVSTANAEAFQPDARGIDVANRTKAFTALDKYLVWAYLRAIGYTAETDENFANWSRYTLKPGKVDGNNDLIADGWNLYVMFSKAGETAAVTPWTDKQIAWNTVTPGGEGLLWTEEYDNGHYPTDPWNAYTIGDRFTIDGVEYVISDKDAYAYHLKHLNGEEGDKYGDFDNDGLANYDEYVIQKNNNRTLAADKMFSYFGSVTVPALAGQCVPDYFLKSTKRNAAASDLAVKTIYDYLGFDYTSHDFIESWWKDQYGLSRTEFAPYVDTDADGWDNWSEARAGTNPKLVAALSLDGEQLTEHPLPVLAVTMTFDGTMSPGGSLVIEAHANGSASQVPDARWTVGGKTGTQEGEEGVAEEGKDAEGDAGSAASRFIGMNPNQPRNYSFGPGKVVPASFKILIKDPNFDHLTFTYRNGIEVQSVYWAHSADDASWVELGNDRARADDPTMGDIIRDGSVVGWINYETGAAYIDFALLQEDKGFGSSESQTDEQGNVVTTGYRETHHTAQSYVKLTWRGKMLALGGRMSFSLSEPEAASEKSGGLLRQGLNTIVAFADQNGNGAYDPGEPYGCVKDVDVGFDKVADLSINLSATSPVLPRFKPFDYAAAAASNALENADVEFEYEVELPVITDRPDVNYVKIVREFVNGIEVQPVTVFEKEIDAESVITEADILRNGVYDLDWQSLADDAVLYSAEGFPALDTIDSVSYVVYVGSDDEVEEHRVGTLKKKFAPKRAKAAPVAPYASHAESIVSETRPTFRWTMEKEGYPAFAFQMLTNGVTVYETVIPAPAKNAAGEYAFQPDLWFGAVADASAHLFTNGKYSWRVAPMNAKFGAPADGEWSVTADFTVQLGDGKVLKTGKGILEVAVRYYGVADVENAPIVAQAFRTADFTGVPDGQTLVTAFDKLGAYDDTNTVNATFLGLEPGDYYVRAFVDTTNDFVRSAWESWGYQNNVGTDRADLYTPVATAVGRDVTGTALVFMEDMDCDGSKVPDCLEEFPVEVEGEFDTDGDGMPDWWEEKYGFDPFDPSDAGVDLDDDGLTNLEEYRHHTLPDFWDTDGDFIPDGVEVNVTGSNPLRPDADEAAKYDVMAMAVVGDVQVYVVTNAAGKAEATYAVRPGENDLAESAVTNWVYTTFTVPFDGNLYIGAPTNFDRSAAAYMTVATNAVLIHGAVYDWYGFDPTTAVPTADSNAVNTVAFTAWDKYVTACYYLPEFGVTDCTALKVGVLDGDNSGLPDGWELYVGFATDTREENPNLASPTFPLTGEAAKIAKVEFDNGHDIADPWNKYWFFEKAFGPKEEAWKTTKVRPYTNAEARHYDIVDGKTDVDRDFDGLTNYQELEAKWDLGLWLCVTNVFTDGTTPDYFKANAGVYAGEKYNGAEWIEREVREAMGIGALNRSGTRDYKDTGWDAWSTARYSLNSESGSTNVVGVSQELALVINYINALLPGEFQGGTLSDVREFFKSQWGNQIRIWQDDGTYQIIEAGTSLGWSGERIDGSTVVTAHDMIKFFGGKELMLKEIAENKEALGTGDIAIPEPKIDLTLRYAGTGSAQVFVEAYQYDMANTEAGVQMSAQWTIAADVRSGLFATELPTPAKGALVQGPALFIAYIGESIESATAIGSTRCEIGYTGAKITIDLGDRNLTALPFVDLNAAAGDSGSTDVSNALASAQCGLWVVRTGVNGVKFEGDNAKYAKAVYYRTLYNNVERGFVYPSEWIAEDFIGVDRYFADAEGIAKELGDGHVDSVDYAILVGHGPFTNWTEAVAHEFTIPYDVKRSFAKNLHFTDATEEALTLSFEVPTDYPYTKYWMKVVDTVNETTNYYGGTRGYLLPNVAGGVVTVDPLKDCGAILSASNKYEFAFALGNDKFGAPVEEDFNAHDDDKANPYRALPLVVNAKHATDGKYLVTVKHPTADLTGGRMTVAAYESEDLANPVAVVTNADCAAAIELVGVRADKKYYLAAWYVADAEDGRPSAAVRAPYDTWGYVCAFDQSSACFTPLAIEATAAGTPVTFYLQDTDFNDNGILDRDESMTTGMTYPYVTGTSPYDPSGVTPFPPTPGPGPEPQPLPPGPQPEPPQPIPPLPPITPPEDDDDARWAYGDVMAYADIPDVLLVKIGTSAADAAWYAVMDLENEGVKLRDEDIPLQTSASKIGSLMTTWNMSSDEVRYLDPTVNEETLVGVGRAATFAGTDAKVLDKRYATVRLVHAQVYAKYGFETGCAAVCLNEKNDPRLVDGIAAAKHPHTKAFTNWDKFLVVRYLEAIGVEGVDEVALRDDPENLIWSLFRYDCYTEWFKYRNRRDSDRDDICDGWELYTMFGQTDLKAFAGAELGTLADAKISPFNEADGLKLTAPTWGDPSDPRTPEKGLLLVEEFDGGYYPTDPWSVDTDRDSVIDYYAYQYHLKGNDAGKDFDWTVLPDGTRTWPGKYVDGDGLSNYAEYLISEVFKYAKLSADEMYSSDGVHDYFRKMGDLYLGEVFTDHDQINDAWEGKYAEYANRDVYDPDRDDDLDGWSNYTEFRAGTDPTKKVSRGLGSDVKQEYPIPVIEAKVVYNGADINLGALVFKAWNDADDAGMTSAPDAIWTFGAVEKEEKSAPGGVQEAEKTEAEVSEKYVGPRPSGVQRYALGGGSVVHGSVVVKVCDEGFVRTTASNEFDNAALWYVAAADKNGKIVSYAGTEIGSIDYDSGLLTLDYSKLSGGADGNYSQGQLVRDGLSDELIQVRDRISLDRSNVLISWNASQIDVVPGGTYYLAESDQVAEAAKSHGHVREGLNTFMCFADTDGSGDYTPGEPFGVVRGVDVGWQGAKFTVELTETAAIADRIRLTDYADDRKATIQGTLGTFLNDRMLWAIPEVLKATNAAQRAELIAFYANVISNRVQIAPPVGAGMKSRIRVVRYGIDDMFCYSAGVYDSGLGMGYDQRVVMEKEFDMNGRDFVSEADFLGPEAFDIDWGTMTGEIVDASGNAVDGVDLADLKVTNMTYLVVVGDGAKDFRGSDDTNTTVFAAGAITRRFERQRSIPACVGIRGGAGIEPAGTVFTAHPTFVWSMPNEDAWASRFGSSYTAFKIRIYDANNDLVYESAMTRAPAQDAEGRFVWTAPISVGGQTPQGKIFANNATYTWCVSMYNAKFRSENADAWSPDGTFSTSVNAQSPMNDAGSSSIGVTVKYTGPVDVLDGCENLTEEVVNGWGAKISAVKGVVRVQAFETADFSGQPVAETQIANRLALTDVTDDLVNGTLTGLKAGTYHIRAYIDQNGNFQKDEFESWGYAKEPVTLGPDVVRLPAVSFFIEDADTNGNVYPDAWEYAYLNDWSESWDAIKDKEAAELRPNGEIVLSSAIYEQLTNGLTGVSTGVSGSRVTVFQSTWFSELILDTYLNREKAPTTTTTFDAIRKAVEKKIVDKTLKVTAITLDAENKQVILAVDAEVDYANLVAGKFASQLYDLTAMGIDNVTCTVKVKVYKKSTLCQEKWELVEEVEKTFGRDEVSVPVELGKEVDLTGGFYKVEVVQ